MSDIKNMLSNFNSFTKNVINGNNQDANTPALNQGKKFKKFKNIQSNLEGNQTFKEGFGGLNLKNLDLGSSSLANQSNNLIANNDYSSQQDKLTSLRQQYETTLTEYETLLAKINGSTTSYMDRVNPTNPYLNKTIKFTTGEVAYVTNQGVAKYIPSKEIWDSVSAPKKYISVNIAWKDIWNNTPGIAIPTNPPLISGTAVKLNQSLGNEGRNVFVNEIISNPETKYKGCYADNQTKPFMTFIGGTPQVPSASLQNGSFEQPQIANNSYQYISSNSLVPGWDFYSVLINNSSDWGFPMPYPGGSQAACIQNTQIFGQWIKLTAGNFVLSFNACGRQMGANKINVYCGLTGTPQEMPSIFTFTPPTTGWQEYSTTFNIASSGNYALGFYGTNTNGDMSSAIQNIKLTQTDVTTSGNYDYNDCQQAAINEGYQYFALQNVNVTTSKGYCAVSNDEPLITSLGKSYVTSSQTPVWDSGTNTQSGNMATLSNIGSLSVLNSQGQAIFSTPADNVNAGGYIGCYTDTPDRAIPNTSNDQYLPLEQCRQLAKDQNLAYFGTQDAHGGDNGWCTGTNDLSSASKYGIANNCTKNSGGNPMGGPWSNAVYSTDQNGSYFLILQDDCNMCVYRGTGPSDNQGAIWSSGTNGKQQQPNPSYAAAKGKYGKNWITQGSTLAAGDFVGSTNGNIALIMQSDGNLVLYTFTNTLNCQTMADKKIGGGIGANALYDIGKVGVKKDMSQLAYVDQDSKLHSYPSDNTEYANMYTNFKGLNSVGNDIPDASYGDANIEKCTTTCNSNAQCAGFVFTTPGNVCWPKTSSMYPNGEGTLDPNSTTYVRTKKPIKTPIGVPSVTFNTDSVTYKNYINGGEMNEEYGLANVTSEEKKQLLKLQIKLNTLSTQLSNFTAKFGTGTDLLENQSKKNVQGIDNYLSNLTNTNTKITNYPVNIDNILNDSDIDALQKNYDYLFWTILATGTLLITMNMIK